MVSLLFSGDGVPLDPEQPLLHADSLAALRGDGVFETMLVRAGRPVNLARHLARLSDGAAALHLPDPDVETLARTTRTAGAEWERRAPGREGVLRIVYARGRESQPDGPPTCYLTVGPVPARVAAARRDGVSAVTLERGYRPGSAGDAPWRLVGIKSLAYAMNTAALRYAAQCGADDAIFLADDGGVLEGPRSSVIVERDGALLTPPRADGVLPGTTQAALFGLAAAHGVPVREERLDVDALHAADGVWLLSSVTLAARVHTLDGRRLNDSAVVDVTVLAESIPAD